LDISQFSTSNSKYSSEAAYGNVTWQSPSNLAIVKYWGKHGVQLPRNPSISITLSEAFTTTTVEYQYDKAIKRLQLSFLFEGKKNIGFENRIRRFLDSLIGYFPFLTNARLVINSSNSFPHSSGIASSASSMSALALCLCSIEQELLSSDYSEKQAFCRKASFISRLGSGSACRSIFSAFSLWGHTSSFADSSDLYAIEINKYHNTFSDLRNDILIVSKTEKAVSSSAGHKLMENNIYSEARFQQAHERIKDLKNHLSQGEIWAFGEMLESEALTLHALMMASNPSYMLMEPNTIHVLNKIVSYRNETKVPIFFSLDAGPNVHIISFEKDRPIVLKLLNELKDYAISGHILNDRIGSGPIKL